MDLIFARQPIFDRKGRRYGYELLYREPGQDKYANHDGDKATSSVMAASFLSMGVKDLTANSKAFINFTENMLLKGVATLFPNKNIVVEILETIEPNPDIIAACVKLRQKGYTLALDDFVLREDYEPLIRLADIIKVDFMQLRTREERQEVIRKIGEGRVTFLAEKVETREDYEMAIELGYKLFQGYFFAKPIIVNTKEIPASKFNQLQLMQLLEADEPEIDNITKVIEKDVAFTYEVLKLTKTMRYYRGNKVQSIRQAAVLMGLKELKKWAYITIIRRLSDHNQEENITTSVHRGRALELIAEHTGNAENKMAYFTLGLLSMIDVLTGCEMSLVVPELPVADEIRQILLGKDRSSAMAVSFRLILAYEKGNWLEAEVIARDLKVSLNQIAESYVDAVMWSNVITS